MNEFAAKQQNLSERIGALELNDDQRIDDGALEAAAIVNPNPPPTMPRPFGSCIGDEALEAAAIAGPYPTMPRPMGFCIGDEALETAGANSAVGPSQAGCLPPTIRGFNCIDDRALESAGREAHPMPTRFGPCIGDEALEEAAFGAAGPTSSPAFCVPTLPGRCIDDRVLESAGRALGPGPTQPRPPFGLCIADEAMQEAAAVTAIGMPTSPGSFRCQMIDNHASETRA